MGNGQFQVPIHVSNEWTESYRHNQKYLKNKITQEEFQFMVLQKDQESQDISLLIERSIYSIPKTPKIIILNDQKGELFILVQQYDLYLVQYLGKIGLTIDILQLLAETLSVFSCLFKKYGPFGITQSMIGLNKNMQIVAWINQNKQKNEVQISLENGEHPQKTMMSQIITIFKKYSRGFLPQQELNLPNNFETLQILLMKMIKKRKIQMSANFAQLRNKAEGVRRALSPQTSFGSLRHNEIKSPKGVDGVSKAGKRNTVPNFLKRMTEKKINFLDGLHHKRTVTIDQTQETLIKERNLIEIKSQKRQKCSSKSLTKVKSLRASPIKYANNNFSGEMFKLSFPTSNYTQKTSDFLIQSGSSSNYIIKKRDFLESKTAKTAKTWKFQSLTPKTVKDNFQSSPTYTQNKSNYWQVNGQSCLFQPPQSSNHQKTASAPIEVNLKTH